MIDNLNRISFTGNVPHKKTIARVIKSYYYASKPLNTIRQGAKQLPILTKIKKFFCSIINANKDYFKK